MKKRKNKDIEEVKNAITDWFADNITIKGQNAVLVRYAVLPLTADYFVKEIKYGN